MTMGERAATKEAGVDSLESSDRSIEANVWTSFVSELDQL